MQNQQQDNLDDIIINSNKGSNLKKLMLAAAVLLLVLILIILITKTLIQPEEKQKTQVILPPEPVSKPVAKPQEPLFEEIPIENENKDTKINEVIGKIKKQAYETDTKETTPNKSVKSSSSKIAQPKYTERSNTHSSKTNNEYYIQVGAFFNYPPDKKFLNAITKEKLSYVIVKGEKNGKTYEKVMIGPYPSRKKAKEALPVIRKRINQNAYITKK
ncbi:SPOR domain-containing protein [Hydrogenimonas thermophila]|uniref:Sporulation related domain-containing protein n=1 Tax=Hydrogenimonas thermophila TaxID=223786 RepID=A0A1I5MJ75_9BACT|nr:SPOR domain-containing protein [Hydrogenimonas thermophila]WOE70919.1 SPOR domain-containing protein [Hydrogenimonas thermophila]WOE73437.1 SPOR domain-containing protein [Hydrogenimonas thermophila]SFP09543.1 Sporulation related domain-containing protein [Hydrogenimonas thermophila]